MLQVLVHGANETDDGGVGSGVHLTLTVGGTLVSGELISAASWFSIQELEAAERGSLDFGSALGQMASMMKETRTDEDGEQLMPNHIHLINACVLHDSQPIPTSRDLRWRGRLDKVDGWNLGSLGW